MPTNPNANKNPNPPRQPPQNQQDDNNRKPAQQQQAGGRHGDSSPSSGRGHAVDQNTTGPNKAGTQNPSRSSWDDDSGNTRSASGNRVDDSTDNGKSRR